MTPLAQGDEGVWNVAPHMEGETFFAPLRYRDGAPR
jgi:hypothetical protein